MEEDEQRAILNDATLRITNALRRDTDEEEPIPEDPEERDAQVLETNEALVRSPYPLLRGKIRRILREIASRNGLSEPAWYAGERLGCYIIKEPLWGLAVLEHPRGGLMLSSWDHETNPKDITHIPCDLIPANVWDVQEF